MSLLSLAYLLLDQPMQKRFASDPSFQATTLLLQERALRATRFRLQTVELADVQKPAGAAEAPVRVFTSPDTATPEAQLLSNGRYHVMVTNAGGGYSRWKDLAVTRWREDTTCDNWGSFCYIRDVRTGEFWSTAYQPTLERPEKYEVISLENSFHGRTFGALSITGQAKYRQDFEPLVPGARFVPVNDLAALEAAVSERTAGIVLEMIQGEGGINPLTPEFVAKARELADRYNALLVADEIQCGVGRPGTYFAYQRTNHIILPDVMVTAKPLACGIPLGVIMANEKAAAAIKLGMHGSTFGGGPLACRVALEFCDILDELLPQIQRVGGYFHVQLNELARKHAVIKEVRGFGLMIGVELQIPGKQLVLDALAEGLLINCTHETVLRFLPPYIVTEKEVDQAVKILAKLLTKAK